VCWWETLKEKSLGRLSRAWDGNIKMDPAGWVNLAPLGKTPLCYYLGSVK